MASDAIVKLIEHGIGLDSAIGRRFVKDFSKAAETGAYKEFRERYKLTRADWAAVPQNSKLIEAAKAERDRRAEKPAKKVPAMGEVVTLHPTQQLIENSELIVDLCRYKENLCSEKFIRRKYRLDNATWERLGSEEGDALVEKIEQESARRVRDGSMKRELAQKHVVRAPTVLAGIMDDQGANARHRIDSAKALNDLSTNGPAGSAPDASRFIISINLSADGKESVLHYNKSRTPLALGEIDPDDIGPDINAGTIAAIAMKNPTESGGGTNTL